MQDQHQNRGLNPMDEPTNQSADANKTGQNYSADSGMASRNNGSGEPTQKSSDITSENGTPETKQDWNEKGINHNNQSAGGGSSTKSDLHNSTGEPAGNV